MMDDGPFRLCSSRSVWRVGDEDDEDNETASIKRLVCCNIDNEYVLMSDGRDGAWLKDMEP